jgi:hypothetical protein
MKPFTASQSGAQLLRLITHSLKKKKGCSVTKFAAYVLIVCKILDTSLANILTCKGMPSPEGMKRNTKQRKGHPLAFNNGARSMHGFRLKSSITVDTPACECVYCMRAQLSYTYLWVWAVCVLQATRVACCEGKCASTRPCIRAFYMCMCVLHVCVCACCTCVCVCVCVCVCMYQKARASPLLGL